MANVYNKPIVIVGGGNEEYVDYLGLRLSQTEPYEYANDEIEMVATYGFYKDTKVTSINLPKVKTVQTSAFQGCSSLININLPSVIEIGNASLRECSALTNINLPNLTTISGSYAFSTCTSLISASLPKLTSVPSRSFQQIRYLKSVNIASVVEIKNDAFYECYGIKAIIITQTNSIATLGSGAFTNCHFINGTVNSAINPEGLKDGYIYVPDSLVASYKSATNWSKYASQIKGLSQLPQEYADLYGIEI